MLESEIERRMTAMITRLGGLSYKFASPNNPGVPDRIVITPEGRIIFVELKTLTGRLSPIQERQIKCLRSLRQDVRVVYGWEEAQAFVEEVLPT